jgi:hypothetical protein
VIVQGPDGPITIHPRTYAAKVMDAFDARVQGQPQPTWTLPGVVPAQPLVQAQATGQAPQGAGQPPASAAQAAGPGTPAPAPATTPSGLPQPNPALGMSFTVGGMTFNPAEMLQRGAPGMVHDAIARGGLTQGIQVYQALNQAQIPFALGERENVERHLSQLAYLQGRVQAEQVLIARGLKPEDHEATLDAQAQQYAGKMLGGGFRAESVAGLANPATRGAEIAALEERTRLEQRARFETGQPGPGIPGGTIPPERLAAEQRKTQEIHQEAMARAQARGATEVAPEDLNAGRAAHEVGELIDKLFEQFLRAKAPGSGIVSSITGKFLSVAANLNSAQETQIYNKMRDTALATLGQIGEEGTRLSGDVLKAYEQNLPRPGESVEVARRSLRTLYERAATHFMGREWARQRLNVPPERTAPVGGGPPPPAGAPPPPPAGTTTPGVTGTSKTGLDRLLERGLQRQQGQP